VRVFVTGSAGFIGSHLMRHLAATGHEVRGFDRRLGLSTTDLPLLHAAAAAFRPDVIVHLGASCSTAVSLRDPAEDFTANAVGTFNVAEAARRLGGIPVVFTSSVKVNPGADGKVAPLGLSKRIGEDYLRLYGDLYDLPYVINRPSTVYGPGQDGTSDSGWVTWFLRAAIEKQPITIHGDGTQSRDILHIDDMARLLVDQVEHFGDYAGGTYAVGGGPDNEVSLNDLLAALEYTNVHHAARLPGDLQRVVTDNTAVTAVRGWRPAVGWLTGVRSTLNHLDRRERP
jgi:nucleoside-diphosphate-sugar epimerase